MGKSLPVLIYRWLEAVDYPEIFHSATLVLIQLNVEEGLTVAAFPVRRNAPAPRFFVSGNKQIPFISIQKMYKFP